MLVYFCLPNPVILPTKWNARFKNNAVSQRSSIAPKNLIDKILANIGPELGSVVTCPWLEEWQPTKTVASYKWRIKSIGKPIFPSSLDSFWQLVASKFVKLLPYLQFEQFFFIEVDPWNSGFLGLFFHNPLVFTMNCVLKTHFRFLFEKLLKNQNKQSTFGSTKQKKHHWLNKIA